MKIWAKFLVEDRLSFRTVTKTNSKNINFREMSNQAWLEAYEAQKAKRLESLKANKDPFSLSGLSKESKNQKPKETKPVVPEPKLPAPESTSNSRSRKCSIDNSAHERIEAEKLASIEAFSQPKPMVFSGTNHLNPVTISNGTKRPNPPIQTVPKIEEKKRKVEEPSIKSLFQKVKNDSKKEVKDWQKEYEERKKLAMAKLNK